MNVYYEKPQGSKHESCAEYSQSMLHVYMHAYTHIYTHAHTLTFGTYNVGNTRTTHTHLFFYHGGDFPLNFLALDVNLIKTFL